MGLIRKLWDSPTAWTILRRLAIAAGLGTVVWELGVWVGGGSTPSGPCFASQLAVLGVLAVVAFVGWGALSSVLAGIEISRLYDPVRGDRPEWPQLETPGGRIRPSRHRRVAG